MSLRSLKARRDATVRKMADDAASPHEIKSAAKYFIHFQEEIDKLENVPGVMNSMLSPIGQTIFDVFTTSTGSKVARSAAAGARVGVADLASKGVGAAITTALSAVATYYLNGITVLVSNVGEGDVTVTLHGTKQQIVSLLQAPGDLIERVSKS
jgi:hypothetical protein